MNTLWSKLSVADQATYTGDTTAAKQADYESQNSVYISAINPAVKATSTYQLKPGASADLGMTTQLTWYAIRDTVDVDLFVCAIEE